MTADWQTHTHEPNDPLESQHGPNLHTHDTTGKVDTVMDLSINALHELEKARLERAAAGQGPNEIEPCETCHGAKFLTRPIECPRCFGTGVR